MSTGQTLYPVGTATITISPQNIASSATFVVGAASDAISNVSNLDLDHLISGTWTSGNTVANTEVQMWIVPVLTDDLSSSQTWPDTFTGSAATVTVTSTGVLEGCARLGTVLIVDTITNSRVYSCEDFSVAALFGGVLPTRYVLFISHNTGVNSNTTAGNFIWQYQRLQGKVA